MLSDNLNKLIGNALVQTGILIKVYTLRLYKKLGFEITPEQYTVLNILNDEGDLHQRQLCKLLFKDKANLARLITVLEQKNLVERIKVSDKRLVNKIKLTQYGLDVRNKINPIMVDLRKKYLSGISEDDFKTCLKVLEKVQENLTEEVKLKI